VSLQGTAKAVDSSQSGAWIEQGRGAGLAFSEVRRCLSFLEEQAMTTTHFSASTRRVCGHTDNTSFHYHSSKARQDEERYARYSLCSDCSRLLRSAWTSAPAGKDAADLELPDLWGGSAKQQAWADRIRRSRQQLVSAFRVRAAAMQEPLLELASLTLDLMFRIQDPGYCIT